MLKKGYFSFHREAGVISLFSFTVVKFAFSLRRCILDSSRTPADRISERLDAPTFVTRNRQGLAKFPDTYPRRICRFGHGVILLSKLQ